MKAKDGQGRSRPWRIAGTLRNVTQFIRRWTSPLPDDVVPPVTLNSERVRLAALLARTWDGERTTPITLLTERAQVTTNPTLLRGVIDELEYHLRLEHQASHLW